VEFIEMSSFTAALRDYLNDEQYLELQLYLTVQPEAGEVIPGTGGFRKLRWADQRRRKGKRGGLRVIYYHLAADTVIWFFMLYDKDETADLSPDEKRLLKAAIEQETRERARRRRSMRS
jgi:hypothetical protein